MSNKTIRGWVIGSDRTEIYVAYSEEEMKAYYRELVEGEEADVDLAEFFDELTQKQMDLIRPIVDNETELAEETSYRRLAEAGDIPGQIISAYW